MRYSVVVDHTLGGAGLMWAVKEHALDDTQVDVVVPADPSESDEAEPRLENGGAAAASAMNRGGWDCR